jgi:hypothetical protein
MNITELNDFSPERLARLLCTDLEGKLELYAIEGNRRVSIGYQGGYEYLPAKAQSMSLVSTLDEVRGFVVLRSPGARIIPLKHNPSFEVHSHSGDVAMVFMTDPGTDIMEILSFFHAKFSHDGDNYRLSLCMPLPRDKWFLLDEHRQNLRTTGCQMFSFEAESLVAMTTVH